MACADELVAELAASRGRDLKRFAYLLAGDNDEAEDLVQVALIKLLESTAITEVRSPFAYAKRTITNEFIDRGRRRQRRQRALVVLSSEPSVVAAADSTIVDRDALLRAFAVLKPRARACIVLRYYDDWDEVSIAAAVGCAPATVRSVIARAMPRLRSALEGGCTGQHGVTGGDR